MTVLRFGLQNLLRWLAGLGLGVACLGTGVAMAQEDPVSAAQRPVVPVPDIVIPTEPTLTTFPKWSEFPTPPRDVPTAAQIAQRVKVQTAASQQLSREVDALVWDKEKPEPFAKAALGRLDTTYMRALDAAMSQRDIEALAAELYRRAAPPPIAD